MIYNLDSKRYSASVQEYLRAYFSAMMGVEDMDFSKIHVYASSPTKEERQKGTAAPLTPEQIEERLKGNGPIFAVCEDNLLDDPVAFIAQDDHTMLRSGKEIGRVKVPDIPPVAYNPPAEAPKPGRFSRWMQNWFGIKTPAMKTFEQSKEQRARYEESYAAQVKEREEQLQKLAPLKEDLRRARAQGSVLDDTELMEDVKEFLDKHAASRRRAPRQRNAMPLERPAADFTNLSKDGTLQINNVMHKDPEARPENYTEEAEKRMRAAAEQKRRRDEVTEFLRDHYRLRNVLTQAVKEGKTEADKQLQNLVKGYLDRVDQNDLPTNLTVKELLQGAKYYTLLEEAGNKRLQSGEDEGYEREIRRLQHTISKKEYDTLDPQARKLWTKVKDGYVDTVWKRDQDALSRAKHMPRPMGGSEGLRGERDVRSMAPEEREMYLRDRAELRQEGKEAAELALRQQKSLDTIWAARDVKRQAVLECLAKHTAEKEQISTEEAMKALSGSLTIRAKLEDAAFLEKAADLAAQNKPGALAKEIAAKKVEKKVDLVSAIELLRM